MVVRIHEATLPEVGSGGGRIPALLGCNDGCAQHSLQHRLTVTRRPPTLPPPPQLPHYPKTWVPQVWGAGSAGDAVGPSASPRTHPRRRCGDSAKGDEWHGVGGDGGEVLQRAGCGRRLHARGKAAAGYVTWGRAARVKLGNAAQGGDGPIRAGGLGVLWGGGTPPARPQQSDAVQQRVALQLFLRPPNPDASW